MKKAKYLLISMRPKQWYKNIILFVGIVFSANILNASMVAKVIPAFIFFCMLSAGEYLINDMLDKERDRKHPVKCKRPIASGELKVSHALLFASLLIVLALLGAYLAINIKFLLISAAYILLVLLYSLILKRLVIVDLLAISVGFVIRAAAGCLAIEVLISPWLIICVFLLALFLALGKRRRELALLGEKATMHRKILEGYSTVLLDHMIGISLGALITSYCLYTFLTENSYMMLTIPVAVYGLFRYLFLVHAKNFGGETEMIFKDKGMVICLISWVMLVVLILYWAPGVGFGFVAKR